MRATFALDPMPQPDGFDFQPEPDMANRIREGLAAHLAEQNDDRPLRLRREARLDTMFKAENPA